jgi:hypothetical protein
MKNSTHQLNDSSKNRKERLQLALRENLLKRKDQQRGRKAQVTPEKLEVEILEGETKSLSIPTAVLVIIMLALLTACGKKGDPDSPKSDNFPRQYPKG